MYRWLLAEEALAFLPAARSWLVGGTIKTATSRPFFSQTLAVSLLNFPFYFSISHSLAYLAGTVLFLFLHNQAAVDPKSFIPSRRWPGGVHCSSHSLTQVISLFSPLVSTLLFSRTGSEFSQQNSFDADISTEEIVLPRHTHCVLSRLR